MNKYETFDDNKSLGGSRRTSINRQYNDKNK